MTISKSRFMAGAQCLKRLYFVVNSPELGAGKTAADFALMEQGRQVGRLARQLFPGGVEVESGDAEEAIRTTRDLIANPDIPAIFEAAFENDGVLVRVDILQRRRDGRWRLVEVKSTADLKEHHLEDLAIQYRVLSRSGSDVASCCLAHVNRDYVFQGGDIDARRFFRIRNLTRKVERLAQALVFLLRSEFRVLAMPKAPDLPPGPHCTNPVTCGFYDRCNPPRTDDYIGCLPYLHASALEKLANMRVWSIRDIPDDFELTEIQRRAATSVQTGKPWYSAGLNKELASLKYPLYFMDFETINPAIPRFEGMRPYDQLPFQWSLHSRREPEAEPEHYEFLATDTSDPRREFISSLCGVLGKSGSIVVYHAGFESGRLSELVGWLPEFEGRIKKIQARLWDLLPVIRNCVYHPAFAGSYSLKSVLPALVPSMTYEGMEVANGQDAGLAWESLVRGRLGHAERERIREALLVYCGQDTLATVRILEQLRLTAATSLRK